MYTIYRESRERKGMTREEAEQYLPCCVKSLQRYESGSVVPDAVIVNAMAEAYGDPFLPLRHCLQHYKIGEFLDQDLPSDGYNLPAEFLKMLEAIHQIEEDRMQMIEIVVDNRIDEIELPRFEHIANHLRSLKSCAQRLLWAEQQTALAAATTRAAIGANHC